ncbi:peptidase S8/S53 domain-containing protein [Aspergillus crustosus]
MIERRLQPGTSRLPAEPAIREMPTQPGVVLDRWVVVLKPYLNPEVRNDHFSTLRMRTNNPANPFNSRVVDEFGLPELKGYAAECNEHTKREIEALPDVLKVEPEQLYTRCAVQQGATWGLERISSRAQLAGDPYTYTYRDNASGAGTVAYVIDTGINDAHEEFERRAGKGPAFVSDGLLTENDIWGHGTHCAGTIGSRAYGVAKQASIIGVKVFSDRTGMAWTSDIIKALEFVLQDVERRDIRGRAVVNLSLGGGASEALDGAVASAARHGVVVCVAAGNDRLIPAEDQSPAREPLAITVGAIDANDNIADFSSRGRVVDILAPGVGVNSCWIDGENTSKHLDGTSMAS